MGARHHRAAQPGRTHDPFLAGVGRARSEDAGGNDARRPRSGAAADAIAQTHLGPGREGSLMNKPTLDHIGIAVKSLDASKIYAALGLTVDHVETVTSQGVRTAFLSAGDANLELLEPTGPDSTVAKFIEKRGEGIHHICFRVDDIEAHLARLKSLGYRLIDEAPVPGAYGCRVAFLHPAAGNGVLIELSEKS